MGLTPSFPTPSFPTSVILNVFRSFFSLDLSPSFTPTYLNNSELKRIKSKSDRTLTQDASVETVNLEVSRKLQDNFQERYKWLVEKRKSGKSVTSTDVIVPAKSLVAVVQQTMTEEVLTKSCKVETDNFFPLNFSVSSPVDDRKKLNNYNTHNINNKCNNPWFVSQWYNSVNGNSYGITIDTKNSDVMLSLETFSKESCNGINSESDSLIEMKFGMENGKEMSLKFNKWDPKTLEILSKAMIETTGYQPIVKNRQDQETNKKEIYSFVYVDRLGRNICCSLDVNNEDVLNKLKMMEHWALQSTDPCDLFDIKINSSIAFRLDLKNPTTIRNLKSLKEESITGVVKKLINPIKKKEKMIEKSLTNCTQTRTKAVNDTQPITVELYSPYTGTFTAIFDVYDHQTMISLQNFTKEFQKSLYEYNLKLNTESNETFEIKLDMANPKVVYELVKMTRKYSVDVVNFNPKLILNSLITIFVPDDEIYLTVDISKSLAYGGLFDVSNPDKKGVQLKIPYAGKLNNLYLDVSDPIVISKIKSFSLATIDVAKINGIEDNPSNSVCKVLTLVTLIFLKTPDFGYQPISLDLADKKVVIQVCNLIRSNPKGNNPTYFEIIDDSGQFLTISLDLNNPDIIEGLCRISKKAWFIGIDATKTTYFTVCFRSERRYKSVKLKLKPSIIDEMITVFDKYRPSYTVLKVFDSRKRCNILFMDSTISNFYEKITNVTGAVEILKPIQENALTFFNSITNNFIDLDLSLSQTRQVFNDFEADYHQSKPLTVIKHYHLDKEDFFFINIDEKFLEEIQSIRSDLGLHVITDKMESMNNKENSELIDSCSLVELDGHFIDLKEDLKDCENFEKLEWIS